MNTVLAWFVVAFLAPADDTAERQRALLKKALEKAAEKNANLKAMEGDFDKLIDLLEPLAKGADGLDDLKKDLLKNPAYCGDFKEKLKKLLPNLDALKGLVNALTSALEEMTPEEADKPAHQALLDKFKSLRDALDTSKLKIKEKIKQAAKLKLYWMVFSGMLDDLCKGLRVEPPAGGPPVAPPKSPDAKNEEMGQLPRRKVEDGFRTLRDALAKQATDLTQGRLAPIGPGTVTIPPGKTAVIRLDGAMCLQPDVPLKNGEYALRGAPYYRAKIVERGDVGKPEIHIANPGADAIQFRGSDKPHLIAPGKDGFEFVPLEKVVPDPSIRQFTDLAAMRVEQIVLTDPVMSRNPEYFRALINQAILTAKTYALPKDKLQEYVRAQVALQIPKETKDADKLVQRITAIVVEAVDETCKDVENDRFDPDTLDAVRTFVPGRKARVEVK
ncbi:MAG: hypothetical protein HYY17_15100 [Planctomycetes bacterium]|nr:hypothetical protein [Planctomycetota bacterium]